MNRRFEISGLAASWIGVCGMWSSKWILLGHRRFANQRSHVQESLPKTFGVAKPLNAKIAISWNLNPRTVKSRTAKLRTCELGNRNRISSSKFTSYETQDPAFSYWPFDQLSIWPFGCSAIQPVRPSTGRAFGGSGLQAVGHSDNWTFQRSGV